MAAIVVPLITALAPEIISLIANLVHRSAPVAEQKYGGGTGPVKFAVVFGDVVTALTAAAMAGKIDKSLPSDESIKVIIQAVVSSMQLSGALEQPPPPVTTPRNGGLTLKPGESITITVSQ